MDRGSERKVPHIGTETRSKLLRDSLSCAGTDLMARGDNLAKVRLIPNDVSRRHLKGIKDLSVMDGDASD